MFVINNFHLVLVHKIFLVRWIKLYHSLISAENADLTFSLSNQFHLDPVQKTSVLCLGLQPVRMAI